MVAAMDNVLQRVAALAGVDADVQFRHASLHQGFASALGWQIGSARLEQLDDRRSALRLSRGFLGSQAATVFAADGFDAEHGALAEVARFAYHSSIHWGVLTDELGAIVFNSHWIREEQWFQLPRIRWSELERHREVIEAITPHGMSTGSLDRLAPQIVTPDRFLTPVDDALVARLDHWRSEALQRGRDIVDLDEDLHVLFAQLFVLRAVEDRGLAPRVPTLESALSDGWIYSERLNEVFHQARKHIQEELFAEPVLERFPIPLVEGIIRDLYTPTQLPVGSQRYNFSWIDADVLGRAYEKYLATIYLPTSPPPQLRLFDQYQRGIEPVSIKKSEGVFYTPSFLSGTLAEQAIHEVMTPEQGTEFVPRIADFSCGSGSFLVEALGVLLRRLRSRDPEKNWARWLIEGKYVVGVDLDARAVQMARMNLWIRFTEEPHALPLPLPRIQEVLVQGDSLGSDVWQQIPSTYDVVLGNPPFIATGSREPREDLVRRFESARGRFDYAYLFVELAVRHLAPSGTIGIVVPNRLFRNRDAGLIRRILSSSTSLLVVIDFGSTEVFFGTSAYIGALVARKLDSIANQSPAFTANESPASTRVVVVSSSTRMHYLGGVLITAMRSSDEYQQESVAGFDMPTPSGEGAWVLLSPSVRRSRLRIEEVASPLGEIASIYQGIRTGANDIFILNLESTDGSLATVRNGLGETAIVEFSLLHPVVFGADIQRYAVLRADQLLLYPYRDGAIVSEEDIRESFPLTYEYLLRYRDLLSTRSTIVSRGFQWYELAWERDEGWLSSSKLLTRDLARETSFTLDADGQVYLVGGTAVVPSGNEWALPLLAYMNSSVASQYLADLASVFRGGFLKFEPRHLAQLPIPNFITELDQTALVLGNLAMEVLQARSMKLLDTALAKEREIDQMVEEVLGIGG